MMTSSDLISPHNRAICPMCRLEMVYTAFVIGPETIWAWICNCRRQPDHVLADIENARLQPLTSLTYEIEVYHEAPVQASLGSFDRHA